MIKPLCQEPLLVKGYTPDSVEMGNDEAAPDEGGKDNTSEDQIIGSIGEWGRWQAKWFLVLCFVALPGGFPRDWKRKDHGKIIV